MHLAVSRSEVVVADSREAVAGGEYQVGGDGAKLLLQYIRSRAVRAQLAPRVEPFRFCALIEATPDNTADVFADALLKVLPRALGRPMLIRRPCASSASFDEVWLVGLIMSRRRSDHASVIFGLQARVSKAYRRSLAFLVTGLAERV